jgi:KipI family sensor histidine kinase inhibitor
VLVEVDSLAEVDAVRAALDTAAERGELPDLTDVVPAARTVLAAVRPGSGGLAAIRAALPTQLVQPPRTSVREVVVPVHYDGPDLDLVARTADMSIADVIAAHTAPRYSVAFCGFAPGFGYLVGLPEPLRQARLDEPRTSVPAGSVGVAGEFTGAYPRASPGGWRLLGHTDLVLFDPRREPPALLAPGDQVRFQALR